MNIISHELDKEEPFWLEYGNNWLKFFVPGNFSIFVESLGLKIWLDELKLDRRTADSAPGSPVWS